MVLATMGPVKDPIKALCTSEIDGVLALITHVEGPSYRPVGAAMAVFEDGDRAGTLSSGCVESDIAHHALAQLDAGQPKLLRYGRGSPFMDIQLPCGGGLEILLVPRPDLTALEQVIAHREARQPCVLEVHCPTGALRVVDEEPLGQTGAFFRVEYLPGLRFEVYGKGPEASTFAALLQSAGYLHRLWSPDDETRAEGAARGCPVSDLALHNLPPALEADPWTAIVLFFHDHDWEPPILQSALRTDAFYIGAQGSQRARDTRMKILADMGVGPEARARLHGPVGLIPSARDSGTLAVSVLAEVLAKAGQMRR